MKAFVALAKDEYGIWHWTWHEDNTTGKFHGQTFQINWDITSVLLLTKNMLKPVAPSKKSLSLSYESFEQKIFVLELFILMTNGSNL